MPDFIGFFSQSSNLIIYVCIALAVMLAVEGLGLFLARAHSYAATSTDDCSCLRGPTIVERHL
jgi:hypothetical protein